MPQANWLNLTALNMMITLFSAGGESTASLIGSAAHILAQTSATSKRRSAKTRNCWAHSSKRCCATSRHSAATTATWSTTPRCAAWISARDRAWCCCGVPPTAIPHISRTPTNFGWIVPARKGHISFGKGAHFCVGAALARLEARIVIGELFERTSHFEATDTGRWLPSLLVRRLESLELSVA